MSRLARFCALAGALVVGLTAGGLAHERLRVNGDGPPLFWPSPTNIGIVINSDGSADISDGSHETAMRMAIQDWNAVDGTNVTLVENTDPVQQARTDWEADNIHLIWFDEANASGFFGGGGIVAITPIWFFLNGQITDADVLFNGSEFSFTTSGQPGRFDVGDVGTHELGHLLGLDHSGWAGGTMYPYVDPLMVLHRSPSLDDVRGLRDISPLGTWGRITGTIERQSDSSPVAGAHVVALDTGGRTAASALTAASGAYTIVGLEAGNYTVYADPLDFPVSSGNLTPGHTIETDFETTYYGSPAVVPGGGTAALGTLSVGANVTVNLGSNFDVYPCRVVRGQTVSHMVRGTGLTAGSTLAVSDPTITLSSVAWFGNSVSFQVTVPVAEANGHVDLEVTTVSGDVNVLPAALEITPPSPTVSNITPPIAAAAGGTAITITGTGFQPGARIVLGDQIYRDGEPGGCTVVDSGTITLTTLPTLAGTHDVVAMDSSGVEGRLIGGFQAAALPVLSSVFPPSGDAAGGTEIILTGSELVPGLAVRIDGVTQSTVIYDDDTRVRVVTNSGTPGGPYLVEIENPGGGIASGAFAYVAQPDPDVTAASPNAGGAGGGTTVMLTGSDFTSDSTVVFGADPDTGLGGVAAASILFIDSSTLEVTTPGHAVGAASVLIQDASSGQATLLAAGFTFTGSGSSGGGGCYVRALDNPSGGPRALLLGGWWMLALLVTTLRMRRRNLLGQRASS